MFEDRQNVAGRLTDTSYVEYAVFFVDYNVFLGDPCGDVKGLMASPVVVDGKDLFAGGEGIIYPGIWKGLV